MVFRFFFDFLFMFLLTRLFNANFKNSFQVVLYYRILGFQTYGKFEKKGLFYLGPK